MWASMASQAATTRASPATALSGSPSGAAVTAPAHIPPQASSTTVTSVSSCCKPCCTEVNHGIHCMASGGGVCTEERVVQQPQAAARAAGRQARRVCVAIVLQGGDVGIQGRAVEV